jgi:hypothetical protein
MLHETLVETADNFLQRLFYVSLSINAASHKTSLLSLSFIPFDGFLVSAAGDYVLVINSSTFDSVKEFLKRRLRDA